MVRGGGKLSAISYHLLAVRFSGSRPEEGIALNLRARRQPPKSDGFKPIADSRPLKALPHAAF